MSLKYSCYVLVLLMLMGCEKAQVELPDGVEHIAHQGAYHFVYVNPRKIMSYDKLALRNSGKSVCQKFDNADYCDVYMWDKRELVSTVLPVKNRNSVFAIYSIRDKKVRLKMVRSR